MPNSKESPIPTMRYRPLALLYLRLGCAPCQPRSQAAAPEDPLFLQSGPTGRIYGHPIEHQLRVGVKVVAGGGKRNGQAP
jgi:hypothetical protein